ncbi:MAG: hypothetical protein AAF970_11175 [Bacteroidota bacterium]
MKVPFSQSAIDALNEGRISDLRLHIHLLPAGSARGASSGAQPAHPPRPDQVSSPPTLKAPKEMSDAEKKKRVQEFISRLTPSEAREIRRFLRLWLQGVRPPGQPHDESVLEQLLSGPAELSLGGRLN